MFSKPWAISFIIGNTFQLLPMLAAVSTLVAFASEKQCLSVRIDLFTALWVGLYWALRWFPYWGMSLIAESLFLFCLVWVPENHHWFTAHSSFLRNKLTLQELHLQSPQFYSMFCQLRHLFHRMLGSFYFFFLAHLNLVRAKIDLLKKKINQ